MTSAGKTTPRAATRLAARFAVLAIALLALAPPATAQVATFDAGSIYDLDPPAQQSTLGEQLLSRVASQRQRGAMQYVRQLGPADVLRTLARPVGRIAFSGDFGPGRPKVGYCTASLVADDLVLTNYHCIAGNPLGKVADALLWMGYLRFKDATGVKQYGLELDPVEASAELDYAIHRVRGAPGKDWGRVRLAAADPGDNTSLFIVHHPGGQDQHISLGACKTSAPALAGEDFLHECATEVGSSGAPVFDFGRRTVIGLHYAGLSELKAAKRMAAIAERSERLRGLMVGEEERGGTESSAAPQAPLSPAALEWQAVQGSTSCAVLASYLEAHGQSPFARYATARQGELNCGEEKVAVGTFPETPALAPAPSPSAGCAGVMTEVVGKGRVCLDPADEARREFQDCHGSLCGPRMVVVPAGSFMMGSPASEEGRDEDEGPQRRVTIRQPFAVGKFEVTFAEWDACVAGGGCTDRPQDRGWGRGRQPVINVRWDDITRQYLPWLNRKLGLSGAAAYRLLSEAEWEYAARAGTTTPFSFSATITTDQANYDGNYTYGSGPKGPYRDRTVEVGSFAPNAFGLHDMHGNVWEWVDDCYVESYARAPTNGSAVTDSGCASRVLRGGAWVDDPFDLRSASRFGTNSGNPYVSLGFRVARSLSR
ncbi:MAG: SUMF1/EgtB/PvdO family nonheme iron enzyme [Rhizobiales bacterium]|nr:SUMF1/EgtB/PvdO family nonheme iron enzyme [Hyphomicrobiales bacterium]